MRLERFSRRVRHAAFALLLLASGTSRALAQGDHNHAIAGQPQEMSAEQKRRAGQLVREVREATAGFQTPDQLPEGYQLMFGCVSGGDFGAMGLHFVNGSLLGDGEVKPESPEIVLYEPLPNGKMRITGVDYLVFQADWEKIHGPHDPPQLDGQLFHLFDSPNRFGLDPFFTLHVWAWKDNPAGTFANWNPNVSCDAFAGDKH